MQPAGQPVGHHPAPQPAEAPPGPPSTSRAACTRCSVADHPAREPRAADLELGSLFGRARLGAGGVVRDPEHRVQAVLEVARAAASLGWGTAGVVASPLPGPAGNVEFFLWLRRDAGPPQEDQVRRAVEEGPQ